MLASLRRKAANWISPDGPSANFSGASQNRLVRDWVTSCLSADAAIRENMYLLRGRSRELADNNSWVSRYAGLGSSNVVGARGIALQMRTDSRDVNRATETAWKLWGRQATDDLRMSWVDVEKLADRTRRIDGECFLRKIPGADNDYGFALQFIDADQLDEMFNRPASATENEIRMGVEVDRQNRPVAYHFWTGQRRDIHYSSNERQRIPADQIIHYYRQLRPNQTRGLPDLTPVMYDLNMLRGYVEAELVAARLAAAKSGFFESELSDAPVMNPDGTAPPPIQMNAEPGLWQILPAGMKFNGVDPTHPTNAFPDFIRAMLQSIASGLNISYASLTSDLKQSNFASSRVGLLSERDMWRADQTFAVDHLSRPVFDTWAPMAWVSGQLDTSVSPSAYVANATWQPRGWPWVDPLKDVQAAVIAKNNRLSSTQLIVAANGMDMQDIYEDHEKELEISQSTGVPLVGGEVEVEDSKDEFEAHDDALALMGE